MIIKIEEMLIRKSEAKKKNNGESCAVHEYETNIENMSVAVADIKGRYPEKGWSKNMECDQIIFIVAGKGVLHVENNTYEVGGEDLVLIEKKKKYKVEGNLKLVVINQPMWNVKQYVIEGV